MFPSLKTLVASLTRVALVGVDLQVALCQVEVLLGDDLVEGEFAASHDFAGSAVAENMSLLGDLSGPGGGAAVALAFV